MRRRRLGRTNLLVSEISLGTVALGLDYGLRAAAEDARPDEQAAAVLLNKALDLGCNLIDTARGYGASEEIIGRALKSRRAEYLIATKVPLFHKARLTGAELQRAIITSAYDSLRALDTDVLDILQVHCVHSVPQIPDEVGETLLELRDRGVVRHLGASVYGEEQALAAIRTGWCDCLQVAYSALDRRLEERLLPAAIERDIGIVVRSVLLRGALTHRAGLLPDELAPVRAAAEQLQALAASAGMALPEMAYRYVLAHPAAHTALVGTVRRDELEQCLRFAEAGHLPGDLVERISGIAVANEELLNPVNWPQ